MQTFFSLEGLEAALRAGGAPFTQTDLVQQLMRLCNDPDPKIQLAAIARLTAYIETCLKLNGRIATLTQQEKTSVSATASVTRTAKTVTAFTPPVPAAPIDIALPEGAARRVDPRPEKEG